VRSAGGSGARLGEWGAGSAVWGAKLASGGSLRRGKQAPGENCGAVKRLNLQISLPVVD
jgi:hypothetical protein